MLPDGVLPPHGSAGASHAVDWSRKNYIINTGQIMANLRVKLGSSAQVGRFVRRREFNDSR